MLDQEVAARTLAYDHAVADHGRAVERMAPQVFAAAQQARDAELRAESTGAPKDLPAFLERGPEDAGATRRSASCMRSRRGWRAGTRGWRWRSTDLKRSGRGAGALFERLAGLLARPGLVALFAFDPALVSAQAQARLLQLPLRLNAAPIDPPALGRLKRRCRRWRSGCWGALAPLMALESATPRAARRLRNTGFPRPAQGADDRLAPALAFALAAEIGGGAEREALEALVKGDRPDAARAPRFAELLKVAQDVGGPIDAEALRRAWALAGTVAG